MQFTRLGQSGLTVSRLCLGCMSYGDPSGGWHGDWLLDEQHSRPFFRKALESGINFFDTANIYSGATKAFGPWRNTPNTRGLSRKSLMQAIDDSLTRLGLDYVDLFQIHRWDDNVPIEETMEALHDIVKAGKALTIAATQVGGCGCCNGRGPSALPDSSRASPHSACSRRS